MSADHTDHKYQTGRSTHVGDDVALTDHAIHRYRERTPHDCPVGIHEAYRRGEDIRDPQVARSPGDMRTPDRVRVYTHGDGAASHAWGIAFLIVAEETPAAERPAHHDCEFVVATVIDLAGFEHGPSRAYLHSHGPHGGPSV